MSGDNDINPIHVKNRSLTKTLYQTRLNWSFWAIITLKTPLPCLPIATVLPQAQDYFCLPPPLRGQSLIQNWESISPRQDNRLPKSFLNSCFQQCFQKVGCISIASCAGVVWVVCEYKRFPMTIKFMRIVSSFFRSKVSVFDLVSWVSNLVF